MPFSRTDKLLKDQVVYLNLPISNLEPGQSEFHGMELETQ